MPNYVFDEAGSLYDLPPTLAEQKSLSLAGKYAQKKENISPAPQIPTPEEVAAADAVINRGAGSTSLLDMAESSVYQGAGGIADTYANIRQNVFGDEDFALSEGVDALSDEEYADVKAGYTGRDEYNRDIQALTESVAQEDKSLADYLNIAGQGLALGPRALADSAASGLELAAGAGATALATAAAGPVGGALVGGAVFGSKVKKAVDAGEKVVSVIDRIKKGAKAVPKTIAKTAGRTSLLTADMTEQMRQDYKEAHNGEEPSAAWYATNVPLLMASNAIEFGLITKAIPKFPKTFIKDMKETVKFMSKSHAKEAAKRIFSGTGKVLSAAGAEAAQEYIQTWHEILAPTASGDSLDAFVRTAAAELGKDENQTEAIVGSILGFAAGGTARGIATVPTVAAGLAKDTAAGTLRTGGKVVKKAAEVAQDAGNRASYAVLPEKQRTVLANRYETAKATFDEKSAAMDEKIKIVKEAKTYDDILADEEVAAIAKDIQKENSWTDGDLENPGKLRSLQNKIAAQYEGDKAVMKTKLYGSNLGRVGRRLKKNIKDITVEAAEKAIDSIPEEAVIATVIKMVEGRVAVDNAVEAVKGLQSGAARGVVDMALKGGKESTKKIMAATRELELGDFDRVVGIVTEHNPELGAQMKREYDKQLEAMKRFGMDSDDVINAETLSPVISDIAKSGSIEGQSGASVVSQINAAMDGVIADIGTLNKVKAAIEVYKKSEFHLNKDSKGRMSDTSLEVQENKLKNFERDLTRKSRAGQAAADAVDTVVEGAKDLGKKAVKKYDKVTRKARLRAARAAGPEEFETVKAELKKERVDQKAAKAQEAKVARETETTVPKETIGQKTERVVTGAAKATVKAVSDVIDTVQYERKPLPANISAGLKSTAEDVANGKNVDGDMEQAIAPMVKQLHKAGLVTELDLADLVKQFPGLAQDEDFYAKLQSHFITDVVSNEDIALKDMAEKLIPKNSMAYLKSFLTGCNT